MGCYYCTLKREGRPGQGLMFGSVPEVIDDGVSGFIVDSEEEALAAIRRIGTLDRRSVRAAFERRFTARRMAEDYLQIYRRLMASPSPASFFKDQIEEEFTPRRLK